MVPLKLPLSHLKLCSVLSETSPFSPPFCVALRPPLLSTLSSLGLAYFLLLLSQDLILFPQAQTATCTKTWGQHTLN